MALSLFAASCASDSDGAEGPGGNVGFGGAQDIGQFRGILDRGEIPGASTLDANGFFSEHFLQLPDADCGQTLCVHGMVSINRDWLENKYQAVLRVALNTTVDPQSIAAKPLDLVVVVDTSGSMQTDDRLTYVVDGLNILIDELDAEDRLGIVSYSGGAVVHATLEDDLEPEELKALVSGFTAAGGTNIYEGLSMGMGMAAAQLSTERESRVILLSDGNITVGENAEMVTALSESYVAEGIGLTTIGVGSEFNVELMRGLAERGAGNFYFIEDADAVREVFADELEYFSVPIALDLEVSVSSDRSHTLGETLGTSLWEVEGNRGTMNIPGVFISRRTSDTPGGNGRRGGGSSLFINMLPSESFLLGETMATIEISYHLPGSSERIVDEIVIENPITEIPEEGYVSHEGMLKAYAMYNIFLGLRKASKEAETDYNCALDTITTLRTKTLDWNEALPTEDITADLALVTQFRDNLLATGATVGGCGEWQNENEVEQWGEDEFRGCSAQGGANSGLAFFFLVLGTLVWGRRRNTSQE